MERLGDHGVELMDWRIYYADGSTFDSSQGEPNDAPPTGVACIMQRDASGREVVKGDDYYYWGGPTDQWCGADRDAVIETLLEGGTVEGLCRGRRQSRLEFQKRVTAAHNDPDFQH